MTADCFAQAQNSFDCLIGQLADPATGAFTHDRLEEVLAEAGRELLRRLLQVHLDLRAERERRVVAGARRQDATAPAGADQVVRRRVETVYQAGDVTHDDPRNHRAGRSAAWWPPSPSTPV